MTLVADGEPADVVVLGGASDDFVRQFAHGREVLLDAARDLTLVPPPILDREIQDQQRENDTE